MKSSNQIIGHWGEDQAAAYLLQRHYKIIERNYRVRGGEIDIIARKGKRLVFVEVKTRTGSQFGPPEEAVTKYQQRRLIATCQYYCLRHHLGACDLQIDVIIVINRDGEPTSQLEHLENVVDDFFTG